MKLNVVSRRLL